MLLSDPPLRHTAKRDSVYRNDRSSYLDLTDLLTRARIDGLIPFEAVSDETRPSVSWRVHPNAARFLSGQLNTFLEGYQRDLAQGQPFHVEIIGEKLTVESTIRPVAGRFCIPYTVGRGYSSLPPRKKLVDRYERSGKSRLALLFLTDFDPEGLDIPPSFVNSLQDDFDCPVDEAIRVALNPGQVRHLRLPANADAKNEGTRYAKFAAEYGDSVHELDAVPIETLQEWLRAAVESVLDLAVFNEQVEREAREIERIDAARAAALDHLQGLPGFGPDDEDDDDDDEDDDE